MSDDSTQTRRERFMEMIKSMSTYEAAALWNADLDKLDECRALLAEAATVFAYLRETDKNPVVLDPTAYVVVMHQDVINQALDLLLRIQSAVNQANPAADPRR